MYKLYEYKGKNHIKLFAQMKNPSREVEDCICYVQEETDMIFCQRIRVFNLFKEI
jgi:hypothetical protein